MAGLPFIIVTLVVAGLVAWAGDVLGRKLGRRRISLFGLRPRRTALLIAVLTGMLITGGTILASFLASENIRQMLLEGTRIIEQRDQAYQERDTANELRDEAYLALDAVRTELYEVTAAKDEELERSQAELDLLNIQLSSVMDELDVRSAALDDLTEEVSQLEEEREENQILIEEGLAQIDDLEFAVDSLFTTISTLNAQISEKEIRLSELEDRIAELNIEIVNLEWDIVAMQMGEVKVIEGQQLGVVLINTNLDQATIYELLQGWIRAIPDTFHDPETGEVVLEDNPIIEISNEEYYRALQEIRAIPASRAAVIAYSTSNIFEDEAITIRIEITGYYKVFPAGVVIYSKNFDAPQDTFEPYRATIAGFFAEAGGYLVDERNFIPVGSGDIIQLTIDDVIDLSEILSDVDFPAEIRMIALRDIYNTNFLLYGDHFTVEIIPGTSDEPG